MTSDTPAKKAAKKAPAKKVTAKVEPNPNIGPDTPPTPISGGIVWGDGQGPGIVNGLRIDYHEADCPGMDQDGNWLGPCDCAKEYAEANGAEALDAVNMQSPRAMVDAVGATLDEVVGKARAQGLPALLGTASVQLVFEVEDATTPIEAVQNVMNQLLQNGFSRYTWLVTDEVTNEIYGVTDGRIVSLEEARVAP